MNPILLSRHVQESLRELVRTTLNSSSLAFEGMVDRFLDNPSNFIKGPWVSVDMPFRQVDGAEGETWKQPFPEVPLSFAPYKHQIDAFERLAGKAMRSTLVTTGTGSGKTESYLWPILDHCRRSKYKPGIKAILIYPMNALATDQARRIAEAISNIETLHGVRAGIYADAEPQNPVHEMTKDGIITHRDSMRKNPPDILLTNYKMLDYLLLRGRDKPLWEQNDPETLRFLVVDELHTFDGAQGADLALLLRRLKYRLKVPKEHIVCIGSSATLGYGEDARVELRSYAEEIFGESFDEESVVTESRKTAKEVFDDPEYLDRPEPVAVSAALREAGELNQPDAALRLATCLFPDRTDPDFAFLYELEPTDNNWRISLGKLLMVHHLCQRTLKIIANHDGPASISAIATGLAQVRVIRDWRYVDLHALAELVVALVAWARSGPVEEPRALFNIKVQLWIREMTRMVADLHGVDAGGARSQVNLYHGRDQDQSSLRHLLPVVNCNRCGATAHVGRQSRDSNEYWAPLDQIYEEFFDANGGERIRLFYHESIERTAVAKGGDKRVVKGLLNPESIAFTPSNHQNIEPESGVPVWMYDPCEESGKLDLTCPACGQARGLILFGLRAARITTAITRTLYTSPQNEEKPETKPRLLMFSDSVQDAAHRAAVAETRNSLQVNQKYLYKALIDTEAGKMNLRDTIEDLPASLLDELDDENFTALFISKEQTWRHSYQDLVREGAKIADSVFLDHLTQRLGWEFFADLSFRSHFSHTLEVSGVAAADVSAVLMVQSADKLAKQLRNELPGAPEFDPDTLARFLSGVLQKMRRQGSIAYYYLVKAVEAGNDRRGLQWFAAQQQVGVGRTGALPAPSSRYGIAPVPVTLDSPPQGFEQITKSRVSNWYRDWLIRTLGQSDIRHGTDPETIYTMLLRRLESDGLVRRVDVSGSQNRHAWLIEPDNVTVTTSTTGLVCSKCKRQEIVISENEQVAIGSLCTRIGCSGQLDHAELRVSPSLRRSLVSDRNHRVVAREHSGLLEADERRRLERGFIDGNERWTPNLISATPTLEMGIDIGNLSTLLLGSVPPAEANYVQRIGRSGRRDGNALNMVLANAKDHDLEFWEDPTPMLAGQIRTPGVFLAAEEVLLRQLTAFTLDAFVVASSEAGDYGKVRDVLKRIESGATAGFPIEWLDMVQGQGDALATEFLSSLPDDVQKSKAIEGRVREFLTSKGEGSIGWRLDAAFGEADDQRKRLVEKRKEATQELKRIKTRSAEFPKMEFERRVREIEQERNRINSFIRSGIDNV